MFTVHPMYVDLHLLFFFKIFVYLAVLSLSFDIQDLVL